MDLRHGVAPGEGLVARGRANQGSIRRDNLGLILQHLRDHGGRPRSQIAAETGLSKATASVLINELVGRGLVSEGEAARDGNVGRPGLIVSLAGNDVCSVGLEIANDYLCLVVMTLSGRVTHRTITSLDVAAMPVADVLDRVAVLISTTLAELAAARSRVTGLVVAAPGVIDAATGAVRFAPNIGWVDIPLATELTRRIGSWTPPVAVENDAKLGAIAEQALVAPGVRDLIYVSGGAGVGGGIISGGGLLRGHDGFAGEIGHLPIGDSRQRCKCGRYGCWEGTIGLPAFLERAADATDPVRDAAIPLAKRLEELRARVARGNTRAADAVSSTFQALGEGVSVVVDVLNPKMVILGGYFAWFGEDVASRVHEVLESRRIGQMATPVEVRTSTLALESAAQGGARLALSTVFRDPTVMGMMPVRIASSGDEQV